jgi:hypothetical protein
VTKYAAEPQHTVNAPALRVDELDVGRCGSIAPAWRVESCTCTDADADADADP